MSSLVLHKGARRVGLDELSEVPAPPQQGRWYPLTHISVLNRVKDTLSESGLVVEREQLGLSRDNHCFFGVLDMKSELAPGVKLAVGVRNSTSKVFPIGFCAGNRVFCCDNLAFSAELLVKRKHTRFGEQRFAHDIAAAMPKLGLFREQEAKRIEIMAGMVINDLTADAMILRAFEKGIVPANQLNQVIREWRNPSFEEFQPRTVWSLFNAFTTILGSGDKVDRNPNRYCVTTQRLNALMLPHEVVGQPMVPA